MRITELRRGAIAPGTVLRWQPADPDIGLGAPSQPVPPSANQASRLASAAARRARGQPHARWLAVVSRLGGPLDVGRLTVALERLASRHSTLRSGFHICDGDMRRFVLPHMRLEPTEVGVTGNREETLALLGRIFDRHTDPLAWPSYCFAAVVRQNEASIVLAFDHMDTDHYSLAVAAHEVVELYSGHELPPAGDYVAHCGEEARGLVQPEQFAATVREWREFLSDGDGTVPRLPLDLGVPEGVAVPMCRTVIELLGQNASTAVESWCRAQGASLFSGLLAAAGVAAGESQFRTVAPIQTRPDRRPALGWYANAAPIRFLISGQFADVVRAAHASARAAAIHCLTPIERVEEAAGEPLYADQASWFSYVDFRRFPGATAFAKRDVHIVASDRTGSGVDLWAYRSHEGIRVTARYPDTQLAHTAVDQFVGTMREVLLAHIGPFRR